MIYPPENFIKHLLFFNKIINFADGIRNVVETRQCNHKNEHALTRLKNE